MAFRLALVFDLFGTPSRRQIVYQMHGWLLYQRLQAGHQFARLQNLPEPVAMVGEQAEFSLS